MIIISKTFNTFLLAMLLLFTQAQAQSRKDNDTLNPKKFERLIKKENSIVIDVRTIEEFNQNHIPGAILIDVNNPEFTSAILKLDQSKTYLLYCKSGRRSAKALSIMQLNGFKKVYHLKGGIENWHGKKE